MLPLLLLLSFLLCVLVLLLPVLLLLVLFVAASVLLPVLLLLVLLVLLVLVLIPCFLCGRQERNNVREDVRTVAARARRRRRAPRDRSAGNEIDLPATRSNMEQGQLAARMRAASFLGSTTSVLPKSVAPGLRFRRKRSRP